MSAGSAPLASGGTNNTGGSLAATGGSSATGGAPSTGGNTTSTTGSKAVGGTPAAGGANATGGTKATGGATNASTTAIGGTLATGGKSAAGGTVATGGAQASGGVSATSGGSRSSGGTSSSAGATAAGATCAKTTCTTCGANGTIHNLNNDNWAGSLTLFISYSADTRSQTVDKGYTAAQWNAAVNSFNVKSFATQVQATGAKNILLMLGQNTGYYNSPNSVYETYAGLAPGTRCSVRDLPMEIADALSPLGIGMYLYLPEDVGWGDTQAAKNFGLSSLANSNWVVDSNFTPKWNTVIKTWADRYGSKVQGWFFDGYESSWGVTQAMAQTYRTTCLTANPCGVVLFNGGSINAISDTERGETNIDTSTGLPAKGLPTSRWNKNDMQTMWDFPLQAAWGQEIADNSPAIYTNANLKTFITAAIKAQTVFALDCRTSLAGNLSVPIYNQLLAIKQ
jgi:hypothetical protein